MDKTLDMAREVKATAYTNRHYPDRTTYTFGPEQLKAFEALVRADERNALTKERDKLRNRIAYLLQPPIVVAVGCFLFAYIVGFK
jgi:hypothetical protein